MPSHNPSVTSKVRLTYVNPWSAVGLAFVAAVAFTLILVAGAVFLWYALSTVGIIDQIDTRVQEVAGTGALQLGAFLTLEKMAATAALFGALITAISPLAGLACAGIYNAAAKLTGGLTVRLSAPMADEAKPATVAATTDTSD